MGLICLIGLMGLMGCSKEGGVQEPAPTPATVELASYVAGYEEFTKGSNESNRASRRAWTPPSPFSLYADDEKSIGVFFTQNPAVADSYVAESFYKSNGKWRISREEGLTAGTSYYLYGYVPYDQSITSTVSLLSGDGFANGAVLTINNVPTVSNADFCVIIGAKNGKDDYNANADYSVTGIQKGDFQYVASTEGSNYVYLLLDHLFSALRVRMRVQGEYAALRTIKLKELKLKTFEGETPSYKKTNVTITLTANAEGNDPITSVIYTPTGESTDAGSVFTSENGHELTTGYQPFTGHFMPQGVTKLTLESTYDVYDTKGNLVRENCTATNALNLSMFSGQTQAQRGCRYTINLTVNPTYLYVLSEPDLDNPTVVVE